MKKKIVFLILGCELEVFRYQYKVCLDTWLSLTNRYDNISYYIIRSSDKTILDEKNNTIWVNCPDDMENTFMKDKLAFEVLLNSGIEFDYMIRTNTSVYVNVDAVDKYCQQISDDNIHCADIISYQEVYYPVGKFIILQPKHLYTIVNCPNSCKNIIDDYLIGKVLGAFNYTVFGAKYIYSAIKNHHLASSSLTFDDCSKSLFISVKFPEESEENNTSQEDVMRAIFNSMKNYIFTEHDINNIKNAPFIIYDNFNHISYSYENSSLCNR